MPDLSRGAAWPAVIYLRAFHPLGGQYVTTRANIVRLKGRAIDNYPWLAPILEKAHG